MSDLHTRIPFDYRPIDLADSIHHSIAEVWLEDPYTFSDVFTRSAQLCIDGQGCIGGVEFTCTGHEHRFGEHTLCVSVVHYHFPDECPYVGREGSVSGSEGTKE